MDNRTPKKKSNLGLIIGIVVAVLLAIVITVVVIVVILVRRRTANLRAANCASNADCPPGFLCNTATGGCAQCLKNTDCGTDGKICKGAVCICDAPTITSAVATVSQSWPPIIDVAIETGSDPAKTKFSAIFRGPNNYKLDSGFNSLPDGYTGTPIVSLHLPNTCDAAYLNYGCSANCGANHSILGSIDVQVESQCGTKSVIKTIPVSGTCDICTATTC